MADFIDIDPAEDETGSLVLALCAKAKRGKTYSALALCQGLGGLTVLCNTEPKRGSLYKGMFDYRLINFDPPFSLERWNQMLDHVEGIGAQNLIIDSGSDQWIGRGGMLEAHHDLSSELAKKWRTDQDRTNMAAWARLRPQEDALLDRILRMRANVVFCLRQEDKTKPVRKQDGGRSKTVIETLGDQTIATKKLPFLTLVNLQLTSEGKYHVMKDEGLVEPLRPIFAKHPVISRELGADLRAWLGGGTADAPEREPPAEPAGRTDAMALFHESLTAYRKAKADGDKSAWAAYIRKLPQDGQDMVRRWTKDGKFAEAERDGADSLL